jgi:hypothetical protein
VAEEKTKQGGKKRREEYKKQAHKRTSGARGVVKNVHKVLKERQYKYAREAGTGLSCGQRARA